MKKLIAIMIAMLMLFSCGNYKRSIAWKHIGTDGYMIELLDSTITMNGLYEICKRDTLSTNLKKWNSVSYYDDEENRVYQWLYIKDTDTNKIYVLTQETDSTYNINIRKIINETYK